MGLARRLLEPQELDLAALYARALSSVVETWLEWSALCSGGRRGGELCRRLEEEARRSSQLMGVVTYLNTRLKTLLVKFFEDFSPGVEVPRQVVVYAVRAGYGLMERLASLSLEDQLERLPYFASVADVVLENYLAARMRHRGSPVAEATADYIGGEVLEPAFAPARRLAEALGVRSSGGLRERYRSYASALARLLIEE